jgi:type IV fimbrial biogenesis protein FimT
MLTRRQANAGMRGFTLAEAMIVVVILAIVSALAAPSFSTMVLNSRVRTGADGILAGLQLARTEAIRRNTNVSFTLGTGAGWTVAVVSPVSSIQTRPAGEGGGAGLQMTTLNNQTSVAFTPTGMVAGYDPGTTLTQVTVAPPAGANGDNLRIDIFAGGQIRMCNPGIADANDPRRC